MDDPNEKEMSFSKPEPALELQTNIEAAMETSLKRKSHSRQAAPTAKTVKGKKPSSSGPNKKHSTFSDRAKSKEEAKKSRERKKNDRKSGNQNDRAAQSVAPILDGDRVLDIASAQETVLGEEAEDPADRHHEANPAKLAAAADTSLSQDEVQTTSSEAYTSITRSSTQQRTGEELEATIHTERLDASHGVAHTLQRPRLWREVEAKAAAIVLDVLQETENSGARLTWLRFLSSAFRDIYDGTEREFTDATFIQTESEIHEKLISVVNILLSGSKVPRSIEWVCSYIGNGHEQVDECEGLLRRFEALKETLKPRRATPELKQVRALSASDLRPWSIDAEVERHRIRSLTKPKGPFLGIPPKAGLGGLHATVIDCRLAERRRLLAADRRRFGGANPLAVPVNSEYKLAPTPVIDPIFERLKALLGKHLPDVDIAVLMSHVGKSTLPYPPLTGAAMMKVAAIIDDKSVAKAEPRLHEHLARWYLEAQNQIEYQYFKHNLAGCLGIQEPELQLFYSIACDRLPVSALEAISKARMAELGQDAVLRSTFPNLAMFFVNKCSATDCNPIHSAGLPSAHNVYPSANGFIAQAPEHRLTASESMQGIELTAPSVNTAPASSSMIPSFLSMGDSSRMPQTIAQAPSTAISATWLPSPAPGHSTPDMPAWVPSPDDAQPHFASLDHDAAINSVADNGSASQMLGVGDDIEVNGVHPHAGEQPVSFAELSTLPPSSYDEASRVGPAPSYNDIDSGAAQAVSQDIVQQERTDDPGAKDVDSYWTLHARYERILELETDYLDTHSQEAKTTKAALAKQASLVDTARKIIKHHKCIEDTTRHDADDEEEYIDWLSNEVCKNMSHANFLKLWRDNEANLNGVLNEDEDQEEIAAIHRWTVQLKKSAMGTEIKARQLRFEQLETIYIENLPSQEDDQETLDRKREERTTLIQKLVKHHDRMHVLIAALAEDQWDRYHQDWLAEQILSETTRDQAMVAWRQEHADLLATMDQGDDEEEVETIKELVEAIENEDENGEAAEEGGGEAGGEEEEDDDEQEGDGEAEGGDDNGDDGEQGVNEEASVDEEEGGDDE